MKIIIFRILQLLSAVSFFFTAFSGCRPGCSVQPVSVNEHPSTGNVLVKKIDVACNKVADIYIRYWLKENKERIFSTPVSSGKKAHSFSLLYLEPAKAYEYEIVAREENCEVSISGVRMFATKELSPVIREMVMPVEMHDTLPDRFSKGFLLIARRDLPGQMYIINAKGNIVWYYTLKGAGFKVAHFTKKSTILSIVAPLSYPTSYGDEILEISLAGDTILHLKKGEKGFDKTIHHEIFYNASHQLATLTLEKKVFDLSRVGGSKTDTITGDGILVLDRQGNKVWNWSVFDVIDPLTDPLILQDKADWLHANSLDIDDDGNYLLSFYLARQIWKVDAKSGKLIWRMGHGGDFTFPNGGEFHESHAVHRTANNQLMLFENGTDKMKSRVLTYKLDETRRKAALDMVVELPLHLYSERMGSAYLTDNASLLICSSQANSVSLADTTGKIVWRIRTGFSPYRAEFIDSLPLN